MTDKTREEWLNEVAESMFPWFAELGHDRPNIRVSIGWTARGMRSKAIGECWSEKASTDGVNEIFISPILDDPIRVAGVLAHEIVHAVAGHEAKHGPKFKAIATAIGLTGKMTATTEGPEFIERVTPILETAGELPHARLNPALSGIKKQRARMIKAECPNCGYTVRTTRKWIDIAVPRCPIHDADMEIEQ